MARRRLDAWKEIAQYLGRDVTTVRRWEKREGLPVHRHLHDKLGSVYAYADEIDAWSERRSIQAGLPNSVELPAAPPLGVEPPRSVHASESRRLRPWRLRLGLAGLAVIVAATVSPRTEHTRGGSKTVMRGGSNPLIRVAVAPPSGVIVDSLVISPDGEQLAFAGKNAGGMRLWIQRLDSAAAESVPGTEGATHPFWSPEGQHVGFFAGGWLKRVALATREVRQIAPAPDGYGGTWNDHGDILFVADTNAPVSHVSASGGDVRAVTVLGSGLRVGHAWPEFLPDGRHFLYTDYSVDQRQYGIYAADAETRASKRLLSVYSSAGYSPDGYLFFVNLNGSLMAQPFDAEQREFRGAAAPIAESVRQRYDLGFKSDFSMSHTGVVAVRSAGADENRLAWIDRRTGRETASIGECAWHSNPTLSSDGTQLAVTAGDGATSDNLWVFDRAAPAGRRITLGPGTQFAPVWSPNADRIIFADASGLFEKHVADGTPAAPVLRTSFNQSPTSWSRDGRYVTVMTLSRATKADVWAWKLTDPPEALPILTGPAQEGQSQISPDGRYLAYASDETGRFEVYVQSFPTGRQRWQVSSGGGADPRWRGDGRELFYIASDRKMMAVRTTLQPTFTFGRGAALFETQLDDVWIGDTRNHYDVTPDGQRFIMIVPKTDRRLAPFTVLSNWQRAAQRQERP